MVQPGATNHKVDLVELAEGGINDVDGFLHSGRNEVSKVCDVVVGNVAVRHRAHLAVTKVITSQQILLIEIVLGSIYSNGLPIAL